MTEKSPTRSVASDRSLSARAERSAVQTKVLATARALSASGLSPGRSGNVSARFEGGMLITPTGVAYEDVSPEQIVFVDADGIAQAGSPKPSSEWHFHLAAYQARPDCHAVVHTHSLNATALACAHRSIPAYHYMVAAAGGADIPLVSYATFGTRELAALTAAGLADRNACLLANHGVVTIGATLDRALDLAREVEVLAEGYIKVLSIGPAHIIPAAEMAVVLEKFKTYGQQPNLD